MSVIRAEAVDRPVRVSVPLRVDFSGDLFLIREFTANLSVGGIFLPTERYVEPRTEGTLTFRGSQWDKPFTVRAIVVRVVAPGESSTQPAGLGIQFLDLDESDRNKLQRLVDGVQDGSVVQSIRRGLQERGGDLLTEIRSRPVDQRLILALHATAREIDALIRDGNPAVVERLLENPRLEVRHVRTISGDPRLPTRALMGLLRHDCWLQDEVVLFRLCAHRAAPFDEIRQLLPQLSVRQLRQMSRSENLHPQVRGEVQRILAARTS